MNILYTTHCPKCRILEKRLIDNGISFEIIDDIDEMMRRNIDSVDYGNVPVFEHNGTRMNLENTLKWIREQTNEK